MASKAMIARLRTNKEAAEADAGRWAASHDLVASYAVHNGNADAPLMRQHEAQWEEAELHAMRYAALLAAAEKGATDAQIKAMPEYETPRYRLGQYERIAPYQYEKVIPAGR
jgi:hypothetical protein